MLSLKPLVLAGACVLVVTVLGGLLLVWPNYRHAAAINAQLAELEMKISKSSTHEAVLQELDRQLDEARGRIDGELKSIPESADVEVLVGKLSLPTDGVAVRDQQITAGQAGNASQNPDSAAMALPVTVEMHAQFDSIFALLTAAESMQRLVRIAGVHLSRGNEPEQLNDDGSPVLTATITLEAIYQPQASAIAAAESATKASAPR